MSRIRYFRDGFHYGWLVYNSGVQNQHTTSGAYEFHIHNLWCECVSAPGAIKNYSCEMKPEYPIKQVLLPFSFSVQHLLSILLIDGP